MRSYKEIAKETGTTIVDVREAMSLAEMRGMCRMHRRQVKEGRFWKRKH